MQKVYAPFLSFWRAGIQSRVYGSGELQDALPAFFRISLRIGSEEARKLRDSGSKRSLKAGTHYTWEYVVL